SCRFVSLAIAICFKRAAVSRDIANVILVSVFWSLPRGFARKSRTFRFRMLALSARHSLRPTHQSSYDIVMRMPGFEDAIEHQVRAGDRPHGLVRKKCAGMRRLSRYALAKECASSCEARPSLPVCGDALKGEDDFVNNFGGVAVDGVDCNHGCQAIGRQD